MGLGDRGGVGRIRPADVPGGGAAWPPPSPPRRALWRWQWHLGLPGKAVLQGTTRSAGYGPRHPSGWRSAPTAGLPSSGCWEAPALRRLEAGGEEGCGSVPGLSPGRTGLLFSRGEVVVCAWLLLAGGGQEGGEIPGWQQSWAQRCLGLRRRLTVQPRSHPFPSQRCFPHGLHAA